MKEQSLRKKLERLQEAKNRLTLEVLGVLGEVEKIDSLGEIANQIISVFSSSTEELSVEEKKVVVKKVSEGIGVEAKVKVGTSRQEGKEIEGLVKLNERLGAVKGEEGYTAYVGVERARSKEKGEGTTGRWASFLKSEYGNVDVTKNDVKGISGKFLIVIQNLTLPDLGALAMLNFKLSPENNQENMELPARSLDESLFEESL
jgi:hypothetical protein